MRILGIDPGYATIGYGIIDCDRGRFSTAAYGAVTSPAGMPFPLRLSGIYDDIVTIIESYKPNQLSVEKLYFNTNTTTAIDVAQARGIILLAAVRAGVEIHEYTPLQVKQSITGYGRAEKHQVMEMTKRLLGLKCLPKPDDAADALALAICHGYTMSSTVSKLYEEEKYK